MKKRLSITIIELPLTFENKNSVTFSPSFYTSAHSTYHARPDNQWARWILVNRSGDTHPFQLIDYHCVCATWKEFHGTCSETWVSTTRELHSTCSIENTVSCTWVHSCTTLIMSVSHYWCAHSLHCTCYSSFNQWRTRRVALELEYAGVTGRSLVTYSSCAAKAIWDIFLISSVKIPIALRARLLTFWMDSNFQRDEPSHCQLV